MNTQKKALLIIAFVLLIVILQSRDTSPNERDIEPPQIEEEVVVETAEDNLPEDTTNLALVTKVSDGDTVKIVYENKEYTVRLIGIDTPELQHPFEPVQCYGPEAKSKLEELILNKEVRIERDVSETDQFDRLLRYLWVEEQLINETMVLEGYAFSSTYKPDIKYQEKFDSAEATAKTNQAGLWNPNTCSGDVYTGTYKDPNNQKEEVPTSKSSGNDSVQGSYVTPTSPYSCSCSKTCKQMSSCEEAYYQLNTCGCNARDNDNDGIPCESICN